jgi:hypothetical protein
MTFEDIALLRLNAQLISNRKFSKPEEVVSWMGAMQAQDFRGAKWSVGLRLPDSCDGDIELAIREKRIIRTWPMRGTLHFVAAADIHWMLDLLAQRVITSSANRHRQLELDEKVFIRTRNLLIKNLEGRRQLTRQAIFQIFESSKIATKNQRGIHIIQQHALEGLICFGSHEGSQPSFVLMDEWVHGTEKLKRDEALYSLALRYFTSHGPATLKDFIWWSGLNAADASRAVELAKKQLAKETIHGNDYWLNASIKLSPIDPGAMFLLPGYDEFILGYTNRSAVIEEKNIKRITPGGGLFIPIIVMDGRVIGTWKRSTSKTIIKIETTPFRRLTAEQRKAVRQEEEKFKRFLNP